MPAWRGAWRWCRAMPTPIWPNIPARCSISVILSQTIQATEKPAQVLEHLLRIGRQAAISLPNFGHWRVRLSLLFGGRMPRTGPGLSLVRHAQHPSLHPGRFRRSGAANGRGDRPALPLNEQWRGGPRCAPAMPGAPIFSPRARSSCCRKARLFRRPQRLQRARRRGARGRRRRGTGHKATFAASTICTPPSPGKTRRRTVPIRCRCRSAPGLQRAAHRARAPSAPARTARRAAVHPARRARRAGHGRKACAPPGPTGWRGWAPPSATGLPAPAPATIAAAAGAGLPPLPSHAPPGCGRRTHRETAAHLPRTRAVRHLSAGQAHHAQRRRHGGDAAFGFGQKRAQIGRGKAIAQQPQPLRHWARTGAAGAGWPPRPLPHRAVIECAQAADVHAAWVTPKP